MNTSPSLFRRIAVLLVATTAVIAAPAPAHAEDGKIRFSLFGSDRIVGSGKLANESRVVTGFQAIALRASMKLVLRQGTREGVELRADDNLLPLIETTVVDRGGVPTLELTFKKGTNLSTRSPVVATIDLVTLKSLSIAGAGDIVGDALKTPGLAVTITGSGNVRLKQLIADEVSAKVSGSGDIEFTGRTTKLGISISGSGDVKTRALEADDVSVSVAGSGDADVTARKTLTVSIAGVGNVKYAGDATVKSSIAGHGSVVKQ
jgi:Putative auto-transporter adhesin, head GIN domain